ncbi:MAG: hypothetical protein KY475_00470 [Planctomycetes bacterium]|nr:hypothetical protein [Planctomycetota bacterium]
MAFRRAAIAVLVAAHVVGGIVAAGLSSDEPAISSALFISLVFCQTSLVGMWGGFSNTHWMLRLVGVAAGVILLTTLLSAGAESDPIFPLFLLVFVATSVVACLLTAGKLLAPFVSEAFLLVQVIVLGLCFVAVALASIWAILGSGRPALRIIPVFFVAGASGWMAAFMFGEGPF